MAQKGMALALQGMNGKEMSYVRARAGADSEAEALRGAGIPRRTFYHWPEERRRELLEVAQEYKRNAVARALQILEDSVADAAEVKVKGLKSRKDHIAQAAADSILDRMMGKPTQRQEITGAGGEPLLPPVDELIAALRKARKVLVDDQG